MRRNLNRIEGFHEATIPRYLPSEFQSHFPMTRGTMEIISWEIDDTEEIPFRNGRVRQARTVFTSRETSAFVRVVYGEPRMYEVCR